MNLTDSFILKCMSGSPVLLEDICAIYPLTLREIAEYGYENFLQSLQLLTMDKPIVDNPTDIYKLFEPLSTFQYFLALASMEEDFLNQAKKAFRLFTRENVIFSVETEQIIIGPIEEKHILNEDYFYEFQRILRKMYLLEKDSDEIIINPNDSPQVIAMKKQMIKNRQKLRKSKKVAADSGKSLNFSDLVGSVAVGDSGLNIENIWNITYYAFHDQLKRMEWREQFDINNRAALAGAKLKQSQLKHWIRPINSKDK